MRKNPRLIGDEHVRSVYQAILDFIKYQPIDHYPQTVIQTVHLITDIHPNIESVESKFNTVNSNKSKDLTLLLDNGEKITVNLFLIRKSGRIQPKNPGAQSLFSKYFLSQQLQEEFNEAFEREYIKYLKDLVSLKIGTHYITNKRELRKLVSNFYPRFSEEINPYRNQLLFSLREISFTLLKNFYNQKDRGFYNAYNEFFMTGDFNIITEYGKRKDDISVYELNPGVPRFNDIKIYKVGKNTVGIKYGEVALTLRFKFESAPRTSIKLAASYDEFPKESEIELVNSNTIKKMMNLLDTHVHFKTSNSSNAIGKCHEAITYSYFLEEYPGIRQVDQDECVKLMDKYYSQLKPRVLEKLYRSTSTIVQVIRDKLAMKYNTFNIEGIELIPESYITNNLNTGDIQLILKVNDEYIFEDISLKAIARKGGKITTKNPGIGTILGPTYFNSGTMKPIVEEVKSKFEIREMDHRESLESIAEELGIQLERASQDQLKKGVESLLGKAMMAVTIYGSNVSYCKDHSEITSPIKVYAKTPSLIQNTLIWNNDLDMISLRVKFSRAQRHGWSTIKLTSEYHSEED